MSYSVPPRSNVSASQSAAIRVALADPELNAWREGKHRGGWPRIHPYDSLLRRVYEAWWVLTGKHSLHRAWQTGYDQHIQDESARRARGGQ